MEQDFQNLEEEIWDWSLTIKTKHGEVLSYRQMVGFIVCAGGAVTALLSGTFLTLKVTDFLQNRDAACRSLAAISKATVAMATGRDNTVWAGTSLDLSEGNLQTGQGVFSVFVLLYVLHVMVLQGYRVTDMMGRNLGGGSGWSLRLKVNRQVGSWHLFLRCHMGHHWFWMDVVLVDWSKGRTISETKRTNKGIITHVHWFLAIGWTVCFSVLEFVF